ncbi:hypothetical protein LTR24_007141 [Lithohypha guttulata]|uniref:Uncharacterized protein n=1 Tax=Lithohypha guttulata TaxID=1690604 RepID=A0ABR0K5T4_9EURO|nr:hypothetical protein LTR24_007141 [Lithohypha guttulata]
MSDDAAEFSEDVHGICDVVRNAHRITIVLGRTGGAHAPADTDTLTLLREWGTRMWTWPEVLLGPAKEKLYVYTRDLPLDQPWKVSKLNFAKQVWDDSAVARQLLDYYENTMTLSRLELVVLALESLKDRVLHGTSHFADGDLSYALMGLMRQRPRVDKTDSAFQAFARLSLANDSDRLMERMICLLPIVTALNNVNGSQPLHDTAACGQSRMHSADQHYWTNMNDYWGAKLWDIEPICQIAGIANNDTVILDGAYGTTIHWDSFKRIAITTRETWSRMLARLMVRATPGWFFLGVLLVATSGPPSSGFSSQRLVGALFMILATVLILSSPMLLLHIYSGKVWNSQPWLIGFEGHMDLREIERKIFGFPCERLSWAPYGSSLSRHRKNEENFIEDECEGTDPLLRDHQQDDPTEYPRPVPTGEEDGESMRNFTIVDTFTMTVAMCSAARPPVIALLCGSEGERLY